MKNIKRKTGVLFILIGGCLIIFAVYLRYEGTKLQKQKVEDFQKSISDVDKSVDENVDDIVINKKKDENEDTLGTIGLIIIPKIDLKAPIDEGIDNKTLKYAAGHFEGTALPGEKGNCCIAGHRSYTYNEMFNRFDEIAKGDEIIINTKKGKYTYLVYDILVVKPEEVDVLNNTKDATLTLVTCTPIRIATHRLIIKGKLKNN